MSKAWGPVSLELASAVTFFQDNRDFLGQTREQDPLYAFQAHLVYSFRRALWVALDGTNFDGQLSLGPPASRRPTYSS